MKNTTLIAVIQMLLLFPIAAFDGSAETLKTVRIEEDRLSLEAENASLRSVLETVARQGIRVKISPDLNKEITASFERREIQKALKSILSPLDFVLVWEKEPGTSRIRPAEIEIFETGKQSLVQPLISDKHFDVVRNPEDGTFYVRNELFLKMKPGTPPSILETILKKYRATVLSFHEKTGIYRIHVPDQWDIPDLIREIAKLKGVDRAEPNYAYRIGLPYRNISPSAAPTGYVNPDPPEDGVPVAVLDSGLMPGSGLDAFVKASLDAVNPDLPLMDGLGHGTQMAMIASGAVLPYGVEGEGTPVPIIPIRAIDDNGFTTAAGIMRSIDFAVENGARVLSLSWGSDSPGHFVEEAMKYAESQNLIIVAGAGNEPTGNAFWPAAYSAVIGVGALTPTGEKWDKSNYGVSVTVSAPGFAAFPVGYKGEAGEYAGTSIAAAYTANLISQYLAEHPDAGRNEIIEHLNRQ